jgi:3-hydroxyisobutyrate dehydrogenase-like beta-hydroxyacid dehydrogenase
MCTGVQIERKFTMNIAFLGLGKMGAPMVRRLLETGQQLTVWNRTPEHAAPIVAAGATLAATPAEAAQNADAVLTMLFDDAANEQVLFGANGVMNALRPGALHIALSTIGVALSQRLAAEHASRGQLYVTEEGRLWIVAAGADSATAAARPLLAPLSRGISVIGTEPSQAHALKLGGNFLISAMIHSLSEAFVYAAGQGIDPEVFLETVNSALFQSPFYAAYGKVMLHPPEQPGATIDLGAKDLRLLREAAAARNTTLSLADNLAQIFTQAQQSGLASEDWAIGQYRMAQRRSSAP